MFSHKRYHMKFVALGVLAFCANQRDVSANDCVRMQLLVVVAENRAFVTYENIPLVVQMVNPNPFPVTLQGFEPGYLEPKLEWSRAGDAEYRRMPASSDSALGGPPVTILGGETIEISRFCVVSPSCENGFPEPGDYLIRAYSHLYAIAPGMPDAAICVKWESTSAKVGVVRPQEVDRHAHVALCDAIAECEETNRRKPDVLEKTLCRLGNFGRFLEMNPGSSYSPEIKWHIARSLTEEFANFRVPENSSRDMLELLEHCSRYCLSRGGAFAREMLEWKQGSNRLLRIAISSNKPNWVEAVVQALDEQYPRDTAARLYRQALLAMAKRDRPGADKALELLARNHADSVYLDRIQAAIKENKP